MAKKKAASSAGKNGKVNKTQAVLEYSKSHPRAKPKDISAALKAEGLDVTPGYVSSIRTANKTKSKKRPATKGAKPATTKRAKPAAAKRAADSSPLDDVKHASELMLQAVDLVVKAGVKEASTLVEMAGRMVDRVNKK